MVSLYTIINYLEKKKLDPNVTSSTYLDMLYLFVKAKKLHTQTNICILMDWNSYCSNCKNSMKVWIIARSEHLLVNINIEFQFDRIQIGTETGVHHSKRNMDFCFLSNLMMYIVERV